MFNIFKRNQKKDKKSLQKDKNEIELTALVLAYEVARSDGEIIESELEVLLMEINKIALIVGKDEGEILRILENFSKSSVSFHEFIEDINKSYLKQDKLSLIEFMWRIAFADGKLDVDEERLVRRIADLIKIKDVEVLRLKEVSKNNNS